MNRKYFLSSLIPASLLLQSFKNKVNFDPIIENQKSKIPSYLVAGDTIGITCPAGYITREEIAPSIIQMKSWGF